MKSAFVALFAFVLIAPVLAQTPPCNAVVREVSLENTKGITSKQVTTLKQLLVGKCFRRENGQELTALVYKQLRNWGYTHATVHDPRRIVVLDHAVQPSPVSIAFDFDLGDDLKH
jgi:hypothetical protein